MQHISVYASRVLPMILTAQGTGSTLSSFQKNRPAGGCCDVSPFEKEGGGRRGKGEGRREEGLR